MLAAIIVATTSQGCSGVYRKSNHHRLLPPTPPLDEKITLWALDKAGRAKSPQAIEAPQRPLRLHRSSPRLPTGSLESPKPHRQCKRHGSLAAPCCCLTGEGFFLSFPPSRLRCQSCREGGSSPLWRVRLYVVYVVYTLLSRLSP